MKDFGKADAPMDRFIDGSTFWQSYLTVLFVRDPVNRHLSFFRAKTGGRERMVGLLDPGRIVNPTTLRPIYNAADTRMLMMSMDNYLSRHLVPGFQNCSEATVAVGMASVNNFDLVMNNVDYPDESHATLLLMMVKQMQNSAIFSAGPNYVSRAAGILSKLDSESASCSGGKKCSTTRKNINSSEVAEPISQNDRVALEALNWCDLALVSHTNSRIFTGHQMHTQNASTVATNNSWGYSELK